MKKMRFVFNSFLEDDEFIIKVFRKPLFFFFHKIFLRFAIWGGLAFAIWFFYPRYEFTEKLNFDINYIWQGIAFFAVIYSLAPLVYWYINGIIMSNESLIMVDWPKPFVRRSTRVDFHNLDEVTVEKLGIRAFLMNYGNIVISKVNGGESYVIKHISGPTKAARTIESYREKILDEKNFTEESALKGLLGGMVQRHVGVHGQPEEAKRHRYVQRYEERNYHSKPEEIQTRNYRDEEREIIRREIYEEERLKRETSRSAKSEPKKPNLYQKLFGSKKTKIEDQDVLVEKELDDGGGIDIDLG